MTVTSIVVGTDGSEQAQAAVRWTAELAAQVGATVTAVHVFDPLAKLGKVEPPVDFAELEQRCRHELDQEWCAPLRQAGVAYTPMVLHGNASDALVDAAEDVGADLLVVGARGHGGLKSRVLGTTSNKVADTSRRPVVIIPSA